MGLHDRAELPERSNFYCVVHTCLQSKRVAQLFVAPVWRVRPCSWSDYEAVSDFAEVVIESSHPVLVHGLVADVSVSGPRVIEPLAAGGLSGTFECYDEAGALILESGFGGNGDAE